MLDVVYCDFEYREDGAQIILGCFYSTQKGREAFDFRDPSELVRFKKFFDKIKDSLWCSYYGPAELQSLITLGIDVTALRFVDAMYESRMITLTHTGHFKNQANLLTALDAFGIKTTTSTAHKNEMRDLILSTDQYTDTEWGSIVKYCWEDVDVLPPLMKSIKQFHAEMDDGWCLTGAEHRGKYIRAISMSDYMTDGFPIDVPLLNRIFDNREAITNYLAEAVNEEHGEELFKYFKKGDRYGFSGLVFSRWVNQEIAAGRIHEWKPTSKGRGRSTEKEYLKAQVVKYPYLKSFYDANKTFNALKMRDLRELLDDSGYIKTNTRAFRAKTGRNGPAPKEGYILGLPKWMRCLIRPKEGMTFIGCDWSQQEIGLAAFLSGDENLRDVFNAGDVYWALAQRAGAIPMDIAAKDKSKYPKHKLTRALYKNLQLGISYGKQVPSMALDVQGTVVDDAGNPKLTYDEAVSVAQAMFDWHKDEFSVYWQWSEAVIDEAYMNGYYNTYDWTYYVDGRTKSTQLLNLPMQSLGASMMRLATIYAVDAGLDLVCSQHDALYISGSVGECSQNVGVLEDCMNRASTEILQGWITLGVDTHVYDADNPYIDEDGEEMRLKILGILDELDY